MCVFVKGFLCVGFSRRVVRYVLFLFVISASEWLDVIFVFVCVFVFVYYCLCGHYVCVCVKCC